MIKNNISGMDEALLDQYFFDRAEEVIRIDPDSGKGMTMYA